MSEFSTYVNVGLRDVDNCRNYECGDVVEVVEFYGDDEIHDLKMELKLKRLKEKKSLWLI